jgi:hypothetical protein
MLPLAMAWGSKVLEIHVQRTRPWERIRRQIQGGGGKMQCCEDRASKRQAPALPIPAYQFLIDKMQFERMQKEAVKEFYTLFRRYRKLADEYKAQYWGAVYRGVDDWLGKKWDTDGDQQGAASTRRGQDIEYHVQQLTQALGQFYDPAPLQQAKQLVSIEFDKVKTHLSSRKDNGAWLIALDINNGKEKETSWGGDGEEPTWSEFVPPGKSPPRENQTTLLGLRRHDARI